jgi:hypothetical protein
MRLDGGYATTEGQLKCTSFRSHGCLLTPFSDLAASFPLQLLLPAALLASSFSLSRCVMLSCKTRVMSVGLGSGTVPGECDSAAGQLRILLRSAPPGSNHLLFRAKPLRALADRAGGLLSSSSTFLALFVGVQRLNLTQLPDLFERSCRTNRAKAHARGDQDSTPSSTSSSSSRARRRAVFDDNLYMSVPPWVEHGSTGSAPTA